MLLQQETQSFGGKFHLKLITCVAAFKRTSTRSSVDSIANATITRALVATAKFVRITVSSNQLKCHTLPSTNFHFQENASAVNVSVMRAGQVMLVNVDPRLTLACH